MIDQMVG